MASQASTREAFEVTLIGLGEGIQKLAMQSGSKVGDLIRAADTSARDYAILIEGEKVDEDRLLEPGMEVFLVPRAKKALARLLAKREHSKHNLMSFLLREDPQAIYRYAESLFDLEELRTSRALGCEGYTTREVLEHLRSLGTS